MEGSGILSPFPIHQINATGIAVQYGLSTTRLQAANKRKYVDSLRVVKNRVVYILYGNLYAVHPSARPLPQCMPLFYESTIKYVLTLR